MCSTREARLARLRAAIDEVALAARADPAGHADPEELAERLAGLWAMIAELDPGLATRLRGYCPDTSLGSWGAADCGAPGLAPRGPGSQAWHRSGHARALLPRRARTPASNRWGSGASGPRADIAGPGEVGRRPTSMPSRLARRDYFPTISTSIVAVTSGCSRTRT